MFRTVTNSLSTAYRKNTDDVRALVFKIYPEFVYKRLDTLPRDQVPVFTFHSVDPLRFETQLRFMVENNYRTVNADQLSQILRGEVSPEENTIALTFDDGRGSLWSTAYPLLKKYGLVAVAFIVPGAVPGHSEKYANLEDVWRGRAHLNDVQLRENQSPLCNWEEILTMHRSGVIDFQSHSTYHHSVFVDDVIVDFVNPALTPSFLGSTFNPVIRQDGHDLFLSEPQWGRPVYRFDAAMVADKRFIEDERLSQHCIEFVKRSGGISFFEKAGWRHRLKEQARDLQNDSKSQGRFQSSEERYADIVRDLAESKAIIEARLGARVRHLCYPWYLGSDLGVMASKEAGFVSNHWGILKTRATNTVGDDPFYIARMLDDYVFSLPGRGRMRLPALLLDKAKRMLSSKQLRRLEVGLEI